MTASAGGTMIRAASDTELSAVNELMRAAGLPLEGLDQAHVVLAAVANERVVGTAALERHEGGGGAAFLLRSVVAVEGRSRTDAAGARFTERLRTLFWSSSPPDWRGQR